MAVVVEETDDYIVIDEMESSSTSHHWARCKNCEYETRLTGPYHAGLLIRTHQKVLHKSR
jgi:hypothetical protein